MLSQPHLKPSTPFLIDVKYTFIVCIAILGFMSVLIVVEYNVCTCS